MMLSYPFISPAALPVHRSVFAHATQSDTAANYKSDPPTKQHKSFFQSRYDRRGHPGGVAIFAFLSSLFAIPAGFLDSLLITIFLGLSYTSTFIIISAICAGGGIILGIISLTMQGTRRKNRGLAIAAIILGVISLIIALSI